MKKTTILVCGGRDYYKYSSLKIFLEDLLNDIWLDDEDTEITLIQGGAPGADLLTKVFALDEYGDCSYIKHKEFPADWKRYGKAAGSIRNKQMLDEGKPDLVVAFPGGRGTADMIRQAKAADVKVLEVK